MLNEKLLIVDDKQLNTQFIIQILKIIGFHNISAAHSGQDALQKVEQISPDLILMDINLGGEMDGIEVTKRIKEKHDIPVIYITAHTDKETISRAKSTAPSGYIIKPLNELQLNIAIEMALYKHSLEKKLKDSEERYRAVIRQSSDGIYIVDISAQQVIESNLAFQNMLGYTDAELKQLPPYDFVVYENEKKESVFNPFKSLKSAINLEQKYRKKDGNIIDVSASTTIIHLGEKELYCTIVRDITELKNILLELEKAQRLESLGTFTGGLAHNFNNLYQGVIGNLSLAKMNIDPYDMAYKYLDKSLEALPRVKNLTQQLITFSKGGFPIMHVDSISDDIKNTAELALSDSNIKFQYSVAPDLWKVKFDESQISQVINNIVSNAVNAIEKNDKTNKSIEISLSNINHDPDETDTNEHPHKYVLISIKDNGAGIKKDIINKIFDPFFTTEAPERIGLGLTISYSIIKRHGGWIIIESETNDGTTVNIYLPAAE